MLPERIRVAPQPGFFGAKSGGCDRPEYNMSAIECVALQKRVVSDLFGRFI
jgi:hypothetical protein